MTSFINNPEYSERVSEPTSEVSDFDFGLSDKKGRAIGARIYLSTMVTRPVSEENAKGWGAQIHKLPAGTYYMLLTSAMRGGETFGAYTGNRAFKTIEERTAAIAKYLKGAKKRAEKEAARAAA